MTTRKRGSNVYRYWIAGYNAAIAHIDERVAAVVHAKQIHIASLAKQLATAKDTIARLMQQEKNTNADVQ